METNYTLVTAIDGKREFFLQTTDLNAIETYRSTFDMWNIPYIIYATVGFDN